MRLLGSLGGRRQSRRRTFLLLTLRACTSSCLTRSAVSGAGTGPRLAGLVTGRVGARGRRPDRRPQPRRAPRGAEVHDRAAVDGAARAHRREEPRSGPGRRRLPRPNDELGELTIGAWELYLHSERVPRGIRPVDDEFPHHHRRRRWTRAPVTRTRWGPRARGGRRGRPAQPRSARHRSNAAGWRRRVLPVAVEGCPGSRRLWTPRACERCGLEVPLYGNIAAARGACAGGQAGRRRSAVRRWPKRPARGHRSSAGDHHGQPAAERRACYARPRHGSAAELLHRGALRRPRRRAARGRLRLLACRARATHRRAGFRAPTPTSRRSRIRCSGVENARSSGR